jgi:hypothetical protein
MELNFRHIVPNSKYVSYSPCLLVPAKPTTSRYKNKRLLWCEEAKLKGSKNNEMKT